ncbi:hypothetical protein I3842_13G173400 [Carya illinoinensis]|uniref:Uncharacterized protein n=1 Tax=Carya illinoinensis TaxID=32201 RepID=A0A922DET3_CARIL|nr:hypothetical protein I3842_13G173400 [Carya illinoinensis]
MLFYEARTLSLLLFGACNIKVQTGLDSIVILTSSWHGLTVFLDRTKTQHCVSMLAHDQLQMKALL